MTLKLNISEKEKSWKIELDPSVLAGKSVGDTIKGAEISPELANYEFEITGGSDLAGFPLSKNVEGIGLKKVLLTKGWGLHSRPKGLRKKKQKLKKGMRIRKTVRGKTIAETTIQINLKVTKKGTKKLAEIFPDQNKAKEVEAPESPKTEKVLEATPTQ